MNYINNIYEKEIKIIKNCIYKKKDIKKIVYKRKKI